MVVEERVILLGRVALAIAQCDPQRLDVALDECRAHESATRDLVDAVLQGIPYSGFPGAIDALGRWATRFDGPESRPPVPAAAHDVTHEATPLGTSGREAGSRIFAEVYGSQAGRVLEELHRHSPRLEGWILEFAYGSVMASGLPLLDIEALGVASLLGQGRRRPLYSHLRGARRVGWGSVELRAYVEALDPWCEREIAVYALEVIEGLS